MNYIEVTFIFDQATESLQSILPTLLGTLGFESFVEESAGLLAYCPEDLFEEETMCAMIRTLPEKKFVHYRLEKIEDKNWNALWEESHQMNEIDVEGKILVHSSHVNRNKPYPYDILINPEQAFGSGTHQTTRMMLKQLLELDFEEENVLDMGCGTGILAIMASKKGAKHVTAIDIDPWSRDNALINAKLNACPNLEVLLGDATLLASPLFEGKKDYQVFLANINRNILCRDMALYVSVLKPGGYLVLSGFYTQDIAKIRETAEKLSCRWIRTLEDEAWSSLAFVKE